MSKTIKRSSIVLLPGALLVSAYVAGCSADNPEDSPVAGAPGAGTSASVGGGGASAGSGSGSGSGGNNLGGFGPAGGQAGTSAGGNPAAGTGPGGAGGVGGGGASAAGGTPTGGSGGGGGTGGGGSSTGKPPVEASSGCGKANPATGTGSSPLTVSGHQYYVKLPTNYDASKPYPVMMMFNPTGNPITWAEQNAGFEAAGPKAAWIRVYPTMANNSSGWGSGDVSFFQPFYDQVLSSYCIDKNRVFAAGESSGGDFVSILGCEHGDKIAVTAPCATKPVNGYGLDVPIKRQCKGGVTAVVIHGKNDNVVGPDNGPKTRDFYVALNKCDTSKMPQPVMGYTTSQSNCVEYQGCLDGQSVFWCQHTDPNYSNTNHGWPAFAPKFLWEYLSEY